MSTGELGTLLSEIADDALPPTDLAERAWQGAARTRRRRVRAVAATAAVAVVATAGWLLSEPARDTGPTPAVPTVTTPGGRATTLPERGWHVTDDGVHWIDTPTVAAEADLPFVGIGLPEVIDPTSRQLDAFIPYDRGGAPVVAMLLRSVGGGLVPDATEFSPVLVHADGSVAPVDLVLPRVRDSQGNEATPISTRAFSADGLRIAFPAGDDVVVLDLQSGEIRPRPVAPRAFVTRVGWTADGQVVAQSDSHTWLLDPTTGQATPADQPPHQALPGAFGTRSTGSGTTGVLTRVTGGVLRETPLGWPVADPIGATMTSTGGAWSAVGSFFLARPEMGPTYQGIAAIRDPGTLPVGSAPEVRLAALGDPDVRSKGCCEVLGWQQGTTKVVYTSAAPGGGLWIWVLTWDVESGRFARASRVLTGGTIVPTIALGQVAVRD